MRPQIDYGSRARQQRSECLANSDSHLPRSCCCQLAMLRPAQRTLRATAHEYYQWRDAAYPVATSDQGDHRYDNRLADYKMGEVLRRREHVSELLSKVSAIAADGWGKDDRIDRILFQSQLAGADFFGRQLDPEGSDPQVYVNECTNAIFSLLKKDYASPRTRGLAATARLEQMPALLQTARTNLTHPVKLYASLAIEAVRGGDELYTVSLMTLADGMSPAERKRLDSGTRRGTQGVA